SADSREAPRSILRGPCSSVVLDRRAVESGDGYVLAQVDVLDGVQQLDALGHRTLERFSTTDQAHAPRAFVHDGRGHCVSEVVLARRSTAVDESDATSVAVEHLVTTEVDGMQAAELG